MSLNMMKVYWTTKHSGLLTMITTSAKLTTAKVQLRIDEILTAGGHSLRIRNETSSEGQIQGWNPKEPILSNNDRTKVQKTVLLITVLDVGQFIAPWCTVTIFWFRYHLNISEQHPGILTWHLNLLQAIVSSRFFQSWLACLSSQKVTIAENFDQVMPVPRGQSIGLKKLGQNWKDRLGTRRLQDTLRKTSPEAPEGRACENSWLMWPKHLYRLEECTLLKYSWPVVGFWNVGIKQKAPQANLPAWSWFHQIFATYLRLNRSQQYFRSQLRWNNISNRAKQVLPLCGPSDWLRKSKASSRGAQMAWQITNASNWEERTRGSTHFVFVSTHIAVTMLDYTQCPHILQPATGPSTVHIYCLLSG